MSSVVAGLAGCATYHAQPLPAGPDLVATDGLKVATDTLAVPGLHSRRFDPGDGLDMAEVVTLAVLNDPDLKAKRAEAGVGAAQLLQAGLLPDPQVSASFSHPTGGPPPLTNGYSLGLMQDLSALVTRGAARASARAHVRQVNLDILWQEWQVAQQARQLYIQARSETRLLKALQTQHRLYADNYRRDQKGLQRGDLTLPTTSADLVVLLDAGTKLRQLQRERNQTVHALDALLGLQPGVVPWLSGLVKVAPLSAGQFATAVSGLPHRRPDLLALQAGYKSQEASVREAILKQFPALSIGPSGGRDTGKVRSIGADLSLTLPLFNRNQGGIAIARATRAQLRRSYQARLDQAVNQAHKLWRDVQLMHRQLQTLGSRLPALEQTADAGQQGFEQGNINAGTYINLRSSLLAKQIEAIRLRASLEQTQAMLETLLGMPLDAREPTLSADQS